MSFRNLSGRLQVPLQPRSARRTGPRLTGDASAEVRGGLAPSRARAGGQPRQSGSGLRTPWRRSSRRPLPRLCRRAATALPPEDEVPAWRPLWKFRGTFLNPGAATVDTVNASAWHRPTNWDDECRTPREVVISHKADGWVAVAALDRRGLGPGVLGSAVLTSSPGTCAPSWVVKSRSSWRKEPPAVVGVSEVASMLGWDRRKLRSTLQGVIFPHRWLSVGWRSGLASG